MGATTLVEGERIAARRRLPRVDYAAHPAYGGMFEADAELGRRAAAELTPLIEEVTEGERDRAERFGYGYGASSALARELAADGCAKRQLEPSQLEDLQRRADPLIGAIRERLAELRAASEPISFRACQEMVGPDRNEALWTLAAQVMRDAGIEQASCDYFDCRAAKLKTAAVMVNQPGQSWCADLFRSAELETPATVGFHVDSTTYPTVKVVLYLSDVGPDEGPFGAIPGSHLWEQGGPGRIRRRAFDRSNLVSRSPKQRRAFLSLPPKLQVKAEFGGDLIEGSPEAVELLSQERVMTGPRGQLNLFDPDAIHRGGLARHGERCVMLLSVAARF
jgi:hypothetical protein